METFKKSDRMESAWLDERGGETVEWPLLLALVLLLAVAGWVTFQGSLQAALLGFAQLISGILS
jgi:Flp pilus assembly pilin Flp